MITTDSCIGCAVFYVPANTV